MWVGALTAKGQLTVEHMKTEPNTVANKQFSILSLLEI